MFYFPPETPFLAQPDQQKIYRDKIIDKLSTIPEEDKITLYGDELHKVIQTYSNRSYFCS